MKASVLKQVFYIGILSLLYVYGTAQQDQTGRKADTLIAAEQMPKYPGGMKEMLHFLQKEIHPPTLIDSLVPVCPGDCKVYVRMTIDTAGYIRNPKILRGCRHYPEFDREVLRVVSLMPRWQPGMQNGRRVNTYYTLPVDFRMR